eukprot:GFUD01072566.1.p1 GENE.GFUD01072566.1~~GFUD01072566.1.p1  ORF type:complete len:154 (-),score=38.14 GFUD01072566.1:397-834(-)
MFENTSFSMFKERFFSKKSKNKKKSHNVPAEVPKQRPRSSSICSIKFPISEDLVEESMAKGLPIIPFGFLTFVIDEEESIKTKTNPKSTDLKSNVFGSLDLKNLTRKSGQLRSFTKKDDYVCLDYSRKMKHRNGVKRKMNKGTNL